MSVKLNIFVDMDNTIAIYDEAIIRVCEELQIDIPTNMKTKRQISEYLRSSGKNDIWTKVQAYCYSSFIKFARPAPYSQEVLKNYKMRGDQITLVSHKTHRPAFPLNVNLRDFAQRWLQQNFHQTFSDVKFFEHMTDKVEFIKEKKPDYMIDDLPKILQLAQLGKEKSILYSNEATQSNDYLVCVNWLKINSVIEGNKHA